VSSVRVRQSAATRKSAPNTQPVEAHKLTLIPHEGQQRQRRAFVRVLDSRQPVAHIREALAAGDVICNPT